MPVPSWLPNAISAARVLLVPIWIWSAETCREASAPCIGPLAILLVIGASDVVDGWLARRFGLSSRLGALLDAVADKLCQVFVVTWLTLRATETGSLAPLPLWFMLTLIARDGVLVAGSLCVRARRGRVEFDHAFHGKASSLALFALLVLANAGAPIPAITYTTAAITILVVVSGALYVAEGVRQWRGTSAPTG